MTTTPELPLPRLSGGRFASSLQPAGTIEAITDEILFEAVGVRVAFSQRTGGFSKPPYQSLNLGTHVGDDRATVKANRSLLVAALAGKHVPTITPNQVHEDTVLTVDQACGPALIAAEEAAAAGADGLLVTCTDLAALLCYADCVPVILVAPDGAFAVVHAGWRGVVAGIAPKALALLARRGFDAAACNVYIGPHIHAECFEVSANLADTFAARFGKECLTDSRHISMATALRTDLVRAGASASRIVDADVCTRCSTDRFFSYRGENGTCGRHGAIAFRTGVEHVHCPTIS